jgi:hypothetical protein
MERVVRFHYPNGVLKEEIHYADQKEHGPWRLWHTNGMLAEEYWMDHGIYRDCVARSWHDNGMLKSEVSWIGEKQSGRNLVLDRDGGIVTCMYTDKKQVVSFHQYEKSRELDPTLPKYPDLGGRNGRISLLSMRPVGREAFRCVTDQDTAIDALRGRGVEIRRWMNDPHYFERKRFGDLDVNAVRSFAEILQTAGAVEIAVGLFGQDVGKGVEDAGALIVKMPDDQAARQRLVEIMPGRSATFFDQRSTSGGTGGCIVLVRE